MQVNSAINFGVRPEKNPNKPSSLKISLIDDQTDLKPNNNEKRKKNNCIGGEMSVDSLVCAVTIMAFTCKSFRGQQIVPSFGLKSLEMAEQ